MGMGVWSLVYSGLIAQVIRAAFYWIKSDWYPGFKFSFASIRDILPYGINVLFTSILFFAIQQFNNLIVGKFYSRDQLGLFNRGSKLPELALGILQSVVVKMSFPLFSKLQDDNIQLQLALKKTIKLVGFVAVPLLVLLFLNAEDLTILLFTEKWRGSVIFLECFCLVKFFEPFISIQRELILARGKSRLLLWLFIITSACEIILAIFIARYGIMYIVLTTFISRLLQYFVYTTTVAKDVQIAWYTQLQWIMPYVLNATVVFLVIKSLDYLPGFFLANSSLLIRIVFKTGLGVAIYYGLAYKFKFTEIALIKNVTNMFSRKVNTLFRKIIPFTSAGRP
jgi:O-antigen/teichoic acid export membrane protein